MDKEKAAAIFYILSWKWQYYLNHCTIKFHRLYLEFLLIITVVFIVCRHLNIIASTYAYVFIFLFHHYWKQIFLTQSHFHFMSIKFSDFLYIFSTWNNLSTYNNSQVNYLKVASFLEENEKQFHSFETYWQVLYL